MGGIGVNQSLATAKYFNQVRDATNAQNILGNCQTQGFTPTPSDFDPVAPGQVGQSQESAATQFATKHGCMLPSDKLHNQLMQAAGGYPGMTDWLNQQQQPPVAQ